VVLISWPDDPRSPPGPTFVCRFPTRTSCLHSGMVAESPPIRPPLVRENLGTYGWSRRLSDRSWTCTTSPTRVMLLAFAWRVDLHVDGGSRHDSTRAVESAPPEGPSAPRSVDHPHSHCRRDLRPCACAGAGLALRRRSEPFYHLLRLPGRPHSPTGAAASGHVRHRALSSSSSGLGQGRSLSR